MTDDLILTARGRRISGWTNVSVTLRADGFPHQFAIAMSWKDPMTRGAVIAAAGDPCEVHLGRNLVVSGYIDQDIVSGDPHSRSLTLTGRGRCQDLTDCCAEWDTRQLISGNALTIAQKLASAYGIDVVLGAGADPGPQVPQWALNFTEKAADIIQRLAQNAGLLAYEDARGRLVLAKVGTDSASTGAIYGHNVESWSVEHSMHERYSEIACAWLGTATLSDLEGGDFFHVETDPNVPRHRRLDIVLADVAEDAKAFTIRRAQWEVSRRVGRSMIVNVQVDSWRDGAGKLWTPNTLVPVLVPDPRVTGPDLVLAEVTFHRSNEGTRADLVLMPREAFAIEPISLLPINTADLTGPGEAP